VGSGPQQRSPTALAIGRQIRSPTDRRGALPLSEYVQSQVSFGAATTRGERDGRDVEAPMPSTLKAYRSFATVAIAV
jgi:hypothetical protein